MEIIRRHVADYISERDGSPADWRNVMLCAGFFFVALSNLLNVFLSMNKRIQPGIVPPRTPLVGLFCRGKRLSAGMANRPNSPVFCKSPTTGPDARTTACQTTSSDDSLRVTVTWPRGIVLCDWKKTVESRFACFSHGARTTHPRVRQPVFLSEH